MAEITIFSSQKGKQPKNQNPLVTQEKEKLENLVDISTKPILKIVSVFPFDFFPDTVCIDTTKVTIVNKEFFASQQIYTVPISSIAHVYAEIGPVFATLRVLPQRVFQEQIIEVKKLWRRDAVKACDIILGLVVATKQKIDVTKLSKEEDLHYLEKKLKKVGEGITSY